MEIGFKEDEFLYLICEYGALADSLDNSLEEIGAVLEKEMGKQFSLRTITKAEYNLWYEANYGRMEEEAAEEMEDADFANLLSQYIPEADVE
ncbi:MAG: hypothetical protein Q4C06_04480 [Bacillota bacterium]|nr:hypothetical protein [Bacillota bacterium]